MTANSHEDTRGDTPGSLQHLRGDRWRVRVYAGRKADGTQRIVSRGFRATDRATARLRAEIVSATIHAELRTERLTLNDPTLFVRMAKVEARLTSALDEVRALMLEMQEAQS